MRKVFSYTLILACLLAPISIFAKSNKKICSLTIENRTGTHITQIIVGETESSNKPQTLVKSMENNTSVVVQIKRNILYDIVLINTDSRQYAKRRQTWDLGTASIIVERRDLQNANIWDKAKNLIDTSAPVLEEVGKAISGSVVEGYKYLKEDEGLKKTIEALGKFTEAGLKVGVDLVIEAGKVTARVTRYTMERIEQECMPKLNEDEKKLIDEYVEFTVIEDE